jgi:acetyltransferase-like isoleucine patch superfamily enzyme
VALASHFELIRRVLSSPGVALREVLALWRGVWCRVTCRVRGVRFEAGRGLRIDGRLDVRGPGRVILGDNVRIGMTVTPWTYSSEATIEVGSDSFINGTSFGCQRQIRVGRRVILGRCSIMDTDFHSLHVDRHDPTSPVRVAPVILEENVWIAAQVGILPGTSIGRNSVVGFGAVCTGAYPANVLIAGNPARVIRTIEDASRPGDA